MVFLIAVFYHSKVAMGRPGRAPRAPKGANGWVPTPLVSVRKYRGLSEKPVTS